MTDIKAAEVKAAHAGRHWCTVALGIQGYGSICEPYRLADALEQALAELERLREPYRLQPPASSLTPMKNPYLRSSDA